MKCLIFEAKSRYHNFSIENLLSFKINEISGDGLSFVFFVIINKLFLLDDIL